MHSKTLGDALDAWDIMRTDDAAVHTFFSAGPAGLPTQTAFSQSTRWPSLDRDREGGDGSARRQSLETDGIAPALKSLRQDGDQRGQVRGAGSVAAGWKCPGIDSP